MFAAKSLNGKSAETHLLFLLNHDIEAEDFPFPFELHEDIEKKGATLTVSGKQITIKAGHKTKFQSIGDYSSYTLRIPNKKKLDGTLYINKAVDLTVTFTIRQMPSYFGEPARIVVEFWNCNGDICGVFKSEGEYFFAEGKATYSE